MDFALLGLAAVLLLLVNGAVVVAEFALVRVRASRIQELKEAGDPRATLVEHIQRNIDEYLGVCQVAITLASVALGMVGSQLTHLVVGNPEDGASVMHAAVVTLGSLALVSGSHIVIGEQVPKSVALRYSDTAILWAARPLYWFRNLVFPALWCLNACTQACLRLMRVPKAPEHETHSEDELRIILDQSQERGVMSFRRLLFMENVFELGELTVKDAMRSRAQVRCLHADLHWSDNEQQLTTWRFSRYPLIDGDADRPIGMIHIKDLYHHRGDNRAPDLRKLARPLLHAKEKQPLEQLLAEMQRRRVHVALVDNEEGRWTGFITLEDILEEIVGTITDEFEDEPAVSLGDVLTQERVVLGVEATSLAGALRAALLRVPDAQLPLEREIIVKAVLERERLAGTYLGHGVALPHARMNGLPNATLILIRSELGIPVEGSLERARLLFLLLTPAGQPRIHQRLQARIAGIIENSDYVEDRLLNAPDAHEVLDALRTGEQASLD